MIWELIDTGHLGHWWLYVIFVICCLILCVGVAVLGVMWKLGLLRRPK